MLDGVLGILVRTSIAYVYLLAILRVSGKRVIRQSTPFDLVVALVVGDMPDDVIFNNVPIAQGLVAMGTIVLIHLAVAYGSYRSVVLERLAGSMPTLVVHQGNAVTESLRAERLNKADLDALLREQEIDSHTHVERAWVEPSGSLGLHRHPEAKPIQKRDLR